MIGEQILKILSQQHNYERRFNDFLSRTYVFMYSLFHVEMCPRVLQIN